MNRLILSVFLVLTIASSVVNGFAVGGMNGGEFLVSHSIGIGTVSVYIWLTLCLCLYGTTYLTFLTLFTIETKKNQVPALPLLNE
jgi:hypothetical protein